MTHSTVQIQTNGPLTIPSEFRKKYSITEGDIFTLIDLGSGSFLLTPKKSKIDQIGNRVAEILAEGNYTFDEIIDGLDEERIRYFHEKYGNG